MRPNLVWIVLDTARADAFEPYGAPPGATPTIADLAARGTAVPYAYAPSNWTMPSHASMFTGLLPRTLGVSRAPGRGKAQACRPVIEANEERFLPAVLQKSGYATAASSSNAWIDRGTGFALGFDRFVRARGRRYERINDEAPKARLRWALDAILARADDGAGAAEVAVERWMSQPADGPFFWFFNLLECHSPYLPPKPYNDLNPWQRLRAAQEAREHLTMGSVWKACAGGFDVPEPALARMRHLYGRSIRLMDDWLHRLLERLDERGVLDDTIVIVTSDHGENFGENRLIGHALSLDDRLIRVPLVAAGPIDLPTDRPVSLVELPRLVADGVGLDRNPWADDELPTGAAVAQYDGPLAPDPAAALEATRQWGLGAEAAERLTGGQACATDGRWKLVDRDGSLALYDLRSDPLESTPVPLESAGSSLEALRHAIGVAAAQEAEPAAVLSPVADDDEMAGLEDQLRLLGYL